MEASRTRRARVVLGVLAVALVGLGVLAREPLWMWATTKRRALPRGPSWSHFYQQRGYVTLHRWTGARVVQRRFWVHNGLKAEETYLVGGRVARKTEWRDNGSVIGQYGLEAGRRGRTSPPWLWGVTDQIEPTIPAWMKDDALWQAALDAQD